MTREQQAILLSGVIKTAIGFIANSANARLLLADIRVHLSRLQYGETQPEYFPFTQIEGGRE